MKRKNEIFSCCLVLLIVGVTLGLFFHLHSRINREKLTPHIDPEQPMVALTFDDGPNPTYTPPLLDLLYRYQAPSTFFILGEKIKIPRQSRGYFICGQSPMLLAARVTSRWYGPTAAKSLLLATRKRVL